MLVKPGLRGGARARLRIGDPWYTYRGGARTFNGERSTTHDGIEVRWFIRINERDDVIFWTPASTDED